MQRTGLTAASGTMVVGYFDCVSFGVFRVFDMPAIAAIDKNHVDLVSRCDKVCTLVVADGMPPLPSTEVRAESARLMKVRASTQVCSVTVIEGTGFFPAAARAALTAIQFLSGHVYPLHTSATVGHASRWVAQQAKRDNDWALALAGAIEAARGSYVEGVQTA